MQWREGPVQPLSAHSLRRRHQSARRKSRVPVLRVTDVGDIAYRLLGTQRTIEHIDDLPEKAVHDAKVSGLGGEEVWWGRDERFSGI